MPKFLKINKLKMLQDDACLHTSAAMKNFMKKENMKVEFALTTSPDLMVVDWIDWQVLVLPLL